MGGKNYIFYIATVCYSNLYLQNGKCSKILNTFLFLLLNELLITKAGIHKMLVRIANSEDPDQTASSGLYCLSQPFWQTTCVQNLRTSTVIIRKEFMESFIQID